MNRCVFDFSVSVCSYLFRSLGSLVITCGIFDSLGESCRGKFVAAAEAAGVTLSHRAANKARHSHDVAPLTPGCRPFFFFFLFLFPPPPCGAGSTARTRTASCRTARTTAKQQQGEGCSTWCRLGFIALPSFFPRSLQIQNGKFKNGGIEIWVLIQKSGTRV